MKIDEYEWYVKLREYICVVHGKLEEKDKKIVNYLAETKTKLVYTTTKELGVEAITNYEVVKENKDYSLVKVVIETGRRNQIRVTFKELGNPIVGDKTYGVKDNGKRLFLHADKLKLYYPVIGKEILFESKIPAEFKKIMKG